MVYRLWLKMGAVASTPAKDTAEYLIGTFVGEESFSLASDYWQKLLELPFDLHWPAHRVTKASEVFGQLTLSFMRIYLFR